MRNIVQNIADDFFKILRFDKNDWYSYWKKYRAKYSPLIENYETSMGLTEDDIRQLLQSMSRPLLDKLMQYWQSVSRDQKLFSSKLVSKKHKILELHREDFTIFLTGLLGLKDWTVVNGNKEKVILIDILSLWKKNIVDQIAEVAFQSVKSFRRGETMGSYTSKKQLFEELANQIEEIISQNNIHESMEEICNLLYENISYYNWVGFYLTDFDEKNTLVLGPFVGEPTEHVKIPFGKGICGQAAEKKTTFIVQNVSKETNYLSCSPKVKSEIVVPIMIDGIIYGELDIDSHISNAFDKDDELFLKNICDKISQKIRSEE